MVRSIGDPLQLLLAKGLDSITGIEMGAGGRMGLICLLA